MGKMTSNGDLAATETGARLAPWMSALVRYVHSNQPDLTNRQLALLLIVYLLPGPHTVRGLAARLHVSKPVLTRALNSLSALGHRTAEGRVVNECVSPCRSGWSP